MSGYIELYSKDVLDLINLGKTTSDFNESMGDYIKVEVFGDNSTSSIGILYSNRLLLRYEDADGYYIGPYHYKSNVGFIEGTDTADGTNNILSSIPVGGGLNEPLVAGGQYKKQVGIYKDDNNRIYIKPNEILKLLNLSKGKYRLRINFLRNIKSTLGGFLKLMKNNLIENGNFFAGLEATQTGDLDRSIGKNNFTRIPNPGFSPYVLEQSGLPDNEYRMVVTGIEPNSSYVFSCWVAWDSVFNGDSGIVSFANASSQAAITNNITAGLPPVLNTDLRGSYLADDESDRVLAQTEVSGLTWYRVYSFVSTNGNADLGSIVVRLGSNFGEFDPSTAPLGKRCFTDLRFEKVATLVGAPIDGYITNLKLETGYSGQEMDVNQDGEINILDAIAASNSGNTSLATQIVDNITGGSD